MKLKYTIGCLVAAFILGGACGRFLAPHKTTTDKHSVTQQDVHKDDHSITTTTRVKKPDGTVITTRTRKNDIVTQKDTHKDTQTHTETVFDASRLTITALMVGVSGGSLGLTTGYGLEVTYRVLGPLSVSAMGASNGLIGVGIGLSL